MDIISLRDEVSTPDQWLLGVDLDLFGGPAEAEDDEEVLARWHAAIDVLADLEDEGRTDLAGVARRARRMEPVPLAVRRQRHRDSKRRTQRRSVAGGTGGALALVGRAA